MFENTTMQDIGPLGMASGHIMDSQLTVSSFMQLNQELLYTYTPMSRVSVGKGKLQSIYIIGYEYIVEPHK